MRARTYLSFILSLVCAANAFAKTAGANGLIASEHHLMPVPASVQFNSGRLAVNKSFTVATRGQTDARLQAGIDRARRRIENRTVMELARGLAGDAASATLLIEASGPGF